MATSERPNGKTTDTADPRCAACGYLLKGLDSNRCPECGETIDLSRCPHCGGTGTARFAPPLWLGVLLLVISVVVLTHVDIAHLRHTKTIFAIVMLPVVAIACIVLRFTGTWLSCDKCDGTGRPKRTR